jgi:hypothetical protein
VLDIGLYRLGHKFCTSLFGEHGAECVRTASPWMWRPRRARKFSQKWRPTSIS